MPRWRWPASTSTIEIQPLAASYGSAAAVAISAPASSRTPNAAPAEMKNDQSSAVWFQPAASESASPPATSWAARRSIASTSELAIANLEFGRLAEARAARLHPVGDPVEHARERNERVAEQRRGLGRVGKQRGRRLGADDLRLRAHAQRELLGEPADRD